MSKSGKQKKTDKHQDSHPTGRLNKKFYFSELERLQLELVKMHEWVKATDLRVIVIFEGRDAAGKGGVIKRITQRLNSRICRVVALGVLPRGRNPNGIFKGMWHIFPLPEKLFSWTGAGTTELAWSGSWVFAPMMNTGIFFVRVRDLRKC